MKLIRWLLGRLILLVDWLTRPQLPDRPAAEQALVDAQTAPLALYQYRACPFCVKVRREMRRLGLNIELRDVRQDPRWREELRELGGKVQVPCLRITTDGDTQWLYESRDIIAYLRQRFASATQTG